MFSVDISFQRFEHWVQYRGERSKVEEHAFVKYVKGDVNFVQKPVTLLLDSLTSASIALQFSNKAFSGELLVTVSVDLWNINNALESNKSSNGVCHCLLKLTVSNVNKLGEDHGRDREKAEAEC